MKTLKKVAALAAALAIASASMTALSLSTSAEDEYGQAYFIGSFGTEGNWDAGDSDGVSVTSITGDGQYTVEWELSSATETGSSWFLCVVIEPTGDVENMTTDTFPNLEVTLDEVTVDGESYDVSGTYINTAYYESSTGVTRIYLHDDWTGVECDVLDDMTITDNITATFTISGLEASDEDTEEEEEDTEEEEETTEAEDEETETTTTAEAEEDESETTTAGVTTADEEEEADTDTEAVVASATAVTSVSNSEDETADDSGSSSSDTSEDTDDTSDATTSDDTGSTSTTAETGDAGIAAVCVAAVAAAALGVATMRSRKK